MIAFYNGHFVPDTQLNIAPDDRGFTLGDGVFDTALVNHGRVKHAMLHFKRLLRHAHILEIKIPFSAYDLACTARALVAQNNVTDGTFVLRTQITRGTGPRGLLPPQSCTPTILMRVFPAPLSHTKPPRVICLPGYKNEKSPLSRIKSLNYLDHQLALMAAQNAGFDDAVLINTQGYVACATTANIFIQTDAQYFTPPLTDGALDGVTRTLYIRALKAQEKTLRPADLHAVNAVFFTNSIRKMQKIEIY